MNIATPSGSENPFDPRFDSARYLFMALLAALLTICVAATATPAAAQKADGSAQSAAAAKAGKKAAKKKKVIKKKVVKRKAVKKKKAAAKKTAANKTASKKSAPQKAKPKKAKKVASAGAPKKKAGAKKKQVKKASKPKPALKKNAAKKQAAKKKKAAPKKVASSKKVKKKTAKKNAAKKKAKKKAVAKNTRKKRSAKRKNVVVREKVVVRKRRPKHITRKNVRVTHKHIYRDAKPRRYREPRRPDALAVFIDGAVRAIDHYNGGRVIGHPAPPPAVAGNRRYVKLLPNGRERIVVIRPNGVRTVTIRARDGSIVRRTRHFPDGRIVVLIDNRPYYAIPRGRPLPPPLPPRAAFPGGVSAPDAGQASAYELERTLSAPPPVPVERNYSIEELRQDGDWLGRLNRVDVKSITFATGSAHIDDYEIPKLADLASAMHKIIAENPREVFMVSGHTDLVGDEYSNLELSNRRAQAIADALVRFYAIPPQNLVTQGYGERYPVIPTPYAERQNRRVSVQRITPLLRTTEPGIGAAPLQVR